MSVTVKVKRKGNLDGLIHKITYGAMVGFAIGGEIMSNAVEMSANDLARYPTGELESTISYDPLTEGIVTRGRIVAGTDHAEPFLFGASVHFVPYAEADDRIKAGLYPHIKPVYEDSDISGGYEPNGAFKTPNVYRYDDRIPIGYMVSSSEHPFMQEGFDATKDTVVQEVANQIAAMAEG